jgi:hypothetical protein
MNPLLAIESQVLAEAREWARQLLKQRLQADAEALGAVCPHSGLVLKDVRVRSITLRTCVGEIRVQAAYGYSTQCSDWLSPARVRWGLAPCQRISPELQQRVDYTATKTGSFEAASAMAKCWGSPVSDDLVRNHVQHLGVRARASAPPAAPPAPKKEAPFALVIMMDGWNVRERGEHWGADGPRALEGRVRWHEVKSAVIYRLDHRGQTESGRGILLQKKVVASPPGTEPLDFGAAVQAQAMSCGLARAQETIVVMDGAAWLWKLAEDRFAGSTALLDFYHASEHLWALARHLHPDDPPAAKAFVEPLLHQLRHGGQDRVITRLGELLERPLDETPDKFVQGSVEYFRTHSDHLDYEETAQRGGPVGSGSMESQCSQFQNRFKRTGQFWSREGLANLLALDVAVRNETFTHLWN